MENNKSLEELDKNLSNRIPTNYHKIEERPQVLKIEKLLKEDDTELILFELPKNLDKSLLNKVKIKNFGGEGKITRMVGNYKGINYSASNPITAQTLSFFTKKDGKSFLFKEFDRYIKVFEHIDMTPPTSENVIPRRLIIKKSLSHRRRKKSKSKNK